MRPSRFRVFVEIAAAENESVSEARRGEAKPCDVAFGGANFVKSHDTVFIPQRPVRRDATRHVVASLATSRRGERNVYARDAERAREKEEEREISAIHSRVAATVAAAAVSSSFSFTRACEKESGERERRRSDFLGEFSRLEKTRDRYRESSTSHRVLAGTSAILREPERKRGGTERDYGTQRAYPLVFSPSLRSPLSSRGHFSSPSSHFPLTLLPRSFFFSLFLARTYARTFARQLFFRLVQRTVRLRGLT